MNPPLDAATDADPDARMRDASEHLPDAETFDASDAMVDSDTGSHDSAVDATLDDDAGTPGPLRFHGLACRHYHCCAIDADQALHCWGDNSLGQSEVPPGRFVSVSVGASHGCAIDTAQRVRCFGRTDLVAAQPLSGSFSEVAVDVGHACALRADGSVLCWGDNTYGQLDAPSVPLRQVQTGRAASCGVTEDANVVCWGLTFDWILPSAKVTDVAIGGAACALTTVGEIVCLTLDFEQPWDTPPAGPFVALALGGYHACTLDAAGALRCFGEGTYGMEGSPECDDSPDHQCGQANPPSGTFTEVAAGLLHTCAIRTDGSVVCFGVNNVGQLDAPQ